MAVATINSVASATSPGVRYPVLRTVKGWVCGCPGHRAHGRCYHADALQNAEDAPTDAEGYPWLQSIGASTEKLIVKDTTEVIYDNHKGFRVLKVEKEDQSFNREFYYRWVCDKDICGKQSVAHASKNKATAMSIRHEFSNIHWENEQKAMGYINGTRQI